MKMPHKKSSHQSDSMRRDHFSVHVGRRPLPSLPEDESPANGTAADNAATAAPSLIQSNPVHPAGLSRRSRRMSLHLMQPEVEYSTDGGAGDNGSSWSLSSSGHVAVPHRRSRRMSLSQQYSLLYNGPHKATKVEPKHPLRAIARLAVICIRLCKLSQESVQEARGQFLSVLQVLDDFGTAIDRRGIFFDRDDYRADKQNHMSAEAKRVLQLNPMERTDREIAYLLVIMRNIPAFSEYPTRMQKKLCRVAWYESYEPRRAIIREGHPPHSFYFILSGTVLVTTFEPQSGITRTLVSLEQGLSFGELAVITGSKRQATVSTKTNVELLCISSSDFVDIFMSGGMKTITDPDHNSFLKSVSFLKHWPIQELAQHPQACMFHYFNRGQVLVRDSNNSDWIYIVKSGSLSVLKKLRHVTASNPDEDEEQNETPQDESRLSWQHRSRRGKRNRKGRKATSSPEVFRNQGEADRRLEQTLPGVFNAKERLGLVDYDRIINDYRSRVVSKPGSDYKTLRLPPISMAPTRGVTAPEPTTAAQFTESPLESEASQLQQPPPPSKGSSLPALVKMPEVEEDGNEADDSGSEASEKIRPVSKTAKGVYLAPTSSSRRRRKRRVEPSTPRVKSDASDTSETKEADSVTTSQEEPITELDRLNADYQRRYREHVGRKTMADQLDMKGTRDFRYSQLDLNPMFVLVQVLERGQYFVAGSVQTEALGQHFLDRASDLCMRHAREKGVSQIVYPEQPSVCLVSNGAELIVLSKRLFLDRASDLCMRHASEKECPYPSDDALQNRLQDYVNWGSYRAGVYRRLVTEVRQKQIRRKQFLPHIPGRHCFRSGPL